MFSPKDLSAIKKLIDQSFDTKLPELEKRLVEKNLEAIKLLIEVEFDEQLDKRLKQYFDKDRMYQKLDYIIGKLDASGNEQVLIANTQEDHEDRLIKLEEIHPQNKHNFAVTS